MPLTWGSQDECFDCVFSYDSFEHFSNPDSVLREAVRVVKSGGHIYLNFGPLYYSPMGLHAYRTITVPYCQFLFTRDRLQDFATAQGLGVVESIGVNGWSLGQFRELWSTYRHRLERIRYDERLDLAHLDVIRHYAACFKRATRCFQDLLVSHIEVLFRKAR